MKLCTSSLVLALFAATSAVAQDAPSGSSQPPMIAPLSIRASELPNPPVIAGDISDRPYTVLGQITAGVRKATLFSKPSSQEKIYRELWERGRKMGADAVVHASYGKSHVAAMSWGQTSATGIAIKFTDGGSTGDPH